MVTAKQLEYLATKTDVEIQTLKEEIQEIIAHPMSQNLLLENEIKSLEKENEHLQKDIQEYRSKINEKYRNSQLKHTVLKKMAENMRR